MKTLSIWKVVRDEWCWFGRELRSYWRISKFQVFPTEKNLLISYWYEYDYFKRLRPNETVYRFLDDLVRAIEERLEVQEKNTTALRLSRYFLRALQYGRIRQLFISFLESGLPEESWRPVMEAVRSAWRMETAETWQKKGGAPGEGGHWERFGGKTGEWEGTRASVRRKSR
jgi:hypothetical protein